MEGFKLPMGGSGTEAREGADEEGSKWSKWSKWSGWGAQVRATGSRDNALPR